MEPFLTIGRVLFGAFFVFGGMMHFMKLSDMTGYAKMKGAPLPKLSTIVTGTVIMLAGLGVIFNINTSLSYLALAAFLVVVTPIMHAFWKDTDPNMKMTDMQMFMKNTALLGAAIALYATSI